MRWLFFVFLFNSLSAKTIEVCTTCSARSPEEALRLAENGDVIRIKKGVYKVHDLVISKSVTIVGEHFPILDAGGIGEGLLLNADNIRVTGVDIRNTSRGSMVDYAGIRVSSVKNICVDGNRLVNTFFGIYLSNVKGALIYGNVLRGMAKDQTNSGNGIHLWKCMDTRILKNTIVGHRDGIYFEFAKGGHIANNVSKNNLRYGLHFMFSDSNTFTNNQFLENGTGVAVMYSKGIAMLHNEFKDNWGSSAYGMLLKDINNSKIRGNRFVKNTVAIYLEGSSRLGIDSNYFMGNGWAVKLLSSCEKDSFVSNDFTSNTFDVSVNGTLYLNHFARNYWEKYDGYDINHDRVGDIPYRPVSLYSMMTERMPFVLFLLRSFIVDLLDKAERNVPSLIPDQVKDDYPRMKPVTIHDKDRRDS